MRWVGALGQVAIMLSKRAQTNFGCLAVQPSIQVCGVTIGQCHISLGKSEHMASMQECMQGRALETQTGKHRHYSWAVAAK